MKLVKSTLYLTLASQKALNYAELDTLFSSVSNIVNQRPIGVKHFTEEDYVAITPNDLLLGGNNGTSKYFLHWCHLKSGVRKSGTYK